MESETVGLMYSQQAAFVIFIIVTLFPFSLIFAETKFIPDHIVWIFVGFFFLIASLERLLEYGIKESILFTVRNVFVAFLLFVGSTAIGIALKMYVIG